MCVYVYVYTHTHTHTPHIINTLIIERLFLKLEIQGTKK